MPKQTFYNLDEEKRKRIIDATYDEFLSYPYNKASIQRISDNAKIPVGSFYQYFEGKDDLYVYIIYKIQKKLNKYYNCDVLDFFSKDQMLNAEKNLLDKENNFFNTLYNAPNEIIRKCFFELGNKTIEVAANKLYKLKEKNQLYEKVDIDLVSYLMMTIGFNIYLYCKDKNLNIEEMSDMKDVFIFEVLAKGILRRENESDNK